MYIVIFLFATLIIAGLAFYAGSLLFKLKAQQQLKDKTTEQRIIKISESIQTIALAIEQQQCNLSEGCIRLFHLLEALPVLDKPNYSELYPNLHALYNEVKDLPTHEARQAQSKFKTRQQDFQREEMEAKLESKILSEIASLTKFSI